MYPPTAGEKLFTSCDEHTIAHNLKVMSKPLKGNGGIKMELTKNELAVTEETKEPVSMLSVLTSTTHLILL